MVNVSQRPLRPPTGAAPPTFAVLDEGAGSIELLPLAQEICRRYRAEFPDEQGRYGEAGNASCIHDNHYSLYWAAESVNGYINMEDEVAWTGAVSTAL